MTGNVRPETMERITTKALRGLDSHHPRGQHHGCYDGYHRGNSVSLAPYDLRPHHTRGRGYQQSIYGYYAEAYWNDRI